VNVRSDVEMVVMVMLRALFVSVVAASSANVLFIYMLTIVMMSNAARIKLSTTVW